jgi:hypothetical protein
VDEGKYSVIQFGRARIVVVSVGLILLIVALLSARPVRRALRESRMQRAESAHYEVLCPPGAVSQQALLRFAGERESLFSALNGKLGGRASNTHLRLILDTNFTPSADQSYVVDGTSILSRWTGPDPRLDSSADAEAILHAVWGPPGNPRISHWAATALVGEWRGEELGMAAAAVVQKLGRQTAASLLRQSPATIPSPEDRLLLGSAWINSLAELNGAAQVHKLYAAQIPQLDITEVAKTLGTTTAEIERGWQLWIDSYLAGMPSASHPMTMPMGAPHH